MIYRTHSAFSGTIALAPVFLPLDINPFFQLPIETFIYSFFVIVVFSLMPDLDEPESYLSKRFPFFFVSHFIALFTKHRGLTHNFIFSIIFFIVLLIASIPYHHDIQHFYFLFYIAFMSYIGHMIGDGMTIGGIKRAFYPISKSTFWTIPKSLRFKTGSLFEHTLFYFIIFPLFSFQIFYFLKINNYLESLFNIKF